MSGRPGGVKNFHDLKVCFSGITFSLLSDFNELGIFSCLEIVRSTLLPNRLGEATMENRGVLHSVWPGPLWTDFSPIKSRSRKELRDGIALFFSALSHGDLDFFMDRPETLRFFTFWHHFGSRYERKHENEAREAAKGQAKKKIIQI